MKAPLVRFAYLIAFLAVVTYAFVTLRGPHGVRALMEKQQLIHTLEKQNAEAARENERLSEHLDRLANDPATQELEVLQHDKLVHPGEKVYITGQPGKK